MFAAMIGLLVFLWGMAVPLSAAPAPIGPAAEQFADGARITVGLTLIAGIRRRGHRRPGRARQAVALLAAALALR
jgi:hypothetical protein